MGRSAKRWLALAALLGVLMMGAGLLKLRVREHDFVFTPAANHANLVKYLPADAERVALPADQGSVAGILFRADPIKANGFWLLHLHGNADSAFSAGQVKKAEALRALGFSVLAFDYRGFGLTPGTASEASMYEDSEAAYRGLASRGIPASRIIVFGHSLGNTAAIMLAALHRPAALVLFGAFTSTADVIAGLHSFLPVRLVLRIHINSLERIGAVHVPLIIAHSQSDHIVPYAHALKLFAAANEPKRLISMEPSNSDAMGGHSSALYEHLDQLEAMLIEILPSFAQGI